MNLHWFFKRYRWVFAVLVFVIALLGYSLLLQSILYPILLFAALFPGIIYLTIVRNSDVGHLEPRGVIALHILIGIFLIYPASIFENFGVSFLQTFGFSTDPGSIIFWILYATIIVAPVEEVLKGFGNLFGYMFHQENDEPTDSIVYSVGIATGFALFENYRYVFSTLTNYSYNDALILAIARSFTAIPLHLGVAMLMGYYLSQYYYPEKFGLDVTSSPIYLIKAFLYPILIHGGYDLVVFLFQTDFFIQVVLALVFIVILNLWVWRKVIYLRNSIVDSIQ